MFIYTYTEAEGPVSRQVAADIDRVIKPAFGDRPGANGHQSTGPRLCARMLQEYEAAQQELSGGLAAAGATAELVNTGPYEVGMLVKSPCGLTFCHAVRGNTAGAHIDIDDLHFHLHWSGAPMEVIDRSRVVEASQAFLRNAPEWKERLAAAFKRDSKGVKLRNMAMNNMDAYLERYFSGTGITYYFDKRHADGHKARLLIRMNAYKTLDLPIPHDDFINRLDLVRPHMVEFALMARDGRFTVRGEARDDWQHSPGHQSLEQQPSGEKPSGIKAWLRRLTQGGGGQVSPTPLKSPLQQQVDDCLRGKRLQYHLTEGDDGRRELHIRLGRGQSMIIDLNRGDAGKRIEHDLGYIPRLVELAGLFPYRLTGPRDKVEWITATKQEQQSSNQK